MIQTIHFLVNRIFYIFMLLKVHLKSLTEININLNCNSAVSSTNPAADDASLHSGFSNITTAIELQSKVGDGSGRKSRNKDRTDVSPNMESRKKTATDVDSHVTCGKKKTTTDVGPHNGSKSKTIVSIAFRNKNLAISTTEADITSDTGTERPINNRKTYNLRTECSAKASVKSFSSRTCVAPRRDANPRTSVNS